MNYSRPPFRFALPGWVPLALTFVLLGCSLETPRVKTAEFRRGPGRLGLAFLERILTGKTVRDDIEKLLGPPDSTISFPDGKIEVVYTSGVWGYSPERKENVGGTATGQRFEVHEKELVQVDQNSLTLIMMFQEDGTLNHYQFFSSYGE